MGYLKKEIIGDCTLYLGDCLDVMPLVHSVDAVICDPPYGTTNCKWDSVIDFNDMWCRIDHTLKSIHSPVVLFGSEPFSSRLRLSNIDHYKYDWIWDKIKSTGFLNAKKQPMRGHELISVFYQKQCLYNPQKTFGHNMRTSKRGKGKANVYNDYDGSVYSSNERFPRTIQAFSSDTQNSSFHPTQKPLALMEFLVKTYTDKGGLVLDFTMGSGTTLAACAKTGRSGIGIELDPDYFDIACKRVEDAYRQGDLFSGGAV